MVAAGPRVDRGAGAAALAAATLAALLPAGAVAQPATGSDLGDRYVGTTVVLLSPPDAAATTAPGGISADKFAAMLRRTLGAFGLDVHEAGGAAAGTDFADAVRLAEDVGRREKALGVVWIDPGSAQSSSVVAHLLDRLTDTTLSRVLPEPPRADDEWYRSASLAVLTMLRSTLADVPDAVAGNDGIARLLDEVEPAPPVRSVAPTAGSGMFPDLPTLAVEATYAGLAQPGVGIWQNGARFAVSYAPLPYLALVLDVDILSDWTTSGRDYLFTYKQVPIGLTVRTAL